MSSRDLEAPMPNLLFAHMGVVSLIFTVVSGIAAARASM